MNALIALAVWCQPHGPVTILTTQHRRPSSSSSSLLCNGIPATKESTPTSNTDLPSDTQGPDTTKPALTNSASHSSIDGQAQNTAASTASPILPNPPSLEPKKSRRSLHQHSPSGSSQSPVGNRVHPASTSPSTNTSTCECQFSVPTGEKSIHSVDPFNSELSYISQPVPVDASLFAPIRMACIRSLSCETYCGREGSVFFGDGVNGYVLSYLFTVYDAQSRGHRVKYTIMTMMTDRVYLVASMEYLISQFQAIASNLQSMANALCPQQQSPASRSLSYSSSHHRGSIMPADAPTKRGRPLTDVLAKPDIFVQLHAAFVAVLSNCSRRLTERHIQGRPINECGPQEQDQEPQSNDAGDQKPTIDSLRELRRVLGRQQFDRLIWNSVVGNQVIVRGEECKIVHEIIQALEVVLPKDCCTIILNGPSYEPSYACNILGLDHSTPIPPDLDPDHFILLDIIMESLDHQIPTPPTSLPANPHAKAGSETTSPVYQADWSSATLVDMKDLAMHLEKTAVADSTSPGGQSDHSRPPMSSPGALYPSGTEPQTQRRRYLLQAGEKPPETLAPNFGEVNGHVTSGAKTFSPHYQRPLLYIDTVNDILDYKMPRSIEAKRLAVLREEWISKSIQFHNLYKAGKTSQESVVDEFLQSLRVDKRDLKILRFFTRCARSSAFQSQKFRSEDPIASVGRGVSD